MRDSLPDGWRSSRFLDLAELHRGYDLPVGQRTTGTIPVVGSNGVVGHHGEAKLNGPGVITGRSGTVGLSFYVDGPHWPLNTALYVSDFKGNVPLFVHYFFRWFDFTPYAAGVSVPTLNRNLVHEAPVSIPPVAQQGSIATVLQQLERAVEIEDRQLEAARSLKAAAVRDLFTRGLRGEAQKETEFGPVPDDWDSVPLEHVAFVQTGVAKGRKLGAGPETVEVPYLRVANVQDGHLDLSEMKTIRIRTTELERYLLEDRDIVLTEGGDFDKLGRGFIWKGEVQRCVHQNHVFAVRVDRGRLVPAFLAYLVQSPYGKAYFLKVAHKTTNLACINTAKLKALPVLLPELAEQHEIVAILDAIDRKIDLHRRKRALLENLFGSLLHKLMTGEVRVSDLDLSALPANEKAEARA